MPTAWTADGISLMATEILGPDEFIWAEAKRQLDALLDMGHDVTSRRTQSAAPTVNLSAHYQRLWLRATTNRAPLQQFRLMDIRFAYKTRGKVSQYLCFLTGETPWGYEATEDQKKDQRIWAAELRDLVCARGRDFAPFEAYNVRPNTTHRSPGYFIIPTLPIAYPEDSSKPE